MDETTTTTDDITPPGEWEERFYDYNRERGQEGTETVTAVYEHIPTGNKLIVTPLEDPDRFPSNRDEQYIAHEFIGTYQAYSELWMAEEGPFGPLFLEFLSSVIPEYRPLQMENRVKGRHRNQKTTTPWIQYTSEAKFDWSVLPDGTLSNMETFQQRPYDYSQFRSNIRHLSDYERLNADHMIPLDGPITVDVFVEGANGDQSKLVRPELGMSQRQKESLAEYLEMDEIDIRGLDVGDVLATAYYDFVAGVPYLQHVEVTENGEQVGIGTSKLRVENGDAGIVERVGHGVRNVGQKGGVL